MKWSYQIHNLYVYTGYVYMSPYPIFIEWRKFIMSAEVSRGEGILIILM